MNPVHRCLVSIAALAALAPIFGADAAVRTEKRENPVPDAEAPQQYQPDRTTTLPGMVLPNPAGQERMEDGVVIIGGHGRTPDRTPPFVGDFDAGRSDFVPYISPDRIYQVRRAEVIAIDIAPEYLARAERKGFRVLRSQRLESVGVSIDILKPPDGMSLKRALKRLRKADPQGSYEPNPVFAGMGRAGALPDDVKPSAGETRIGIVDTGFDATRPAFSLTDITQRNFGRGATTTPRDHGAHVAALAVKNGAGELLVADAFSGDGEFADAEGLARSLDWLASQNVPVINMSIAGPRSELLELAVKRLIARGHVIVAAVGNDGPDTPPQFPAAYPSVIGVTAVDRTLDIYEFANRGPGVDIAAVGVDLIADDSDAVAVSGTSFAAPAVAAFLASRIRDVSPGAARFSNTLIREQAIDLGAPGRDPVYGSGFLSPDQSFAKK